ncbi:hypothetical protein EYF80_022774 [Liparis tanakae]|uniref:Uncharacterized protein n=1 Tax=Liparis tanakae TaxID=230148 RepID=A0A4Z2HN83_9TELE|nr:hypothetical protein EYF80_022774 [Liparis tanakae]
MRLALRTWNALVISWFMKLSLLRTLATIMRRSNTSSSSAMVATCIRSPRLSSRLPVYSAEKTVTPDLAGKARMKQHERWTGMLLEDAGVQQPWHGIGLRSHPGSGHTTPRPDPARPRPDEDTIPDFKWLSYLLSPSRSDPALSCPRWRRNTFLSEALTPHANSPLPHTHDTLALYRCVLLPAYFPPLERSVPFS